MRNNKVMKNAIALALAASMTVGAALPAFADAAVTKDETVYVVLNADGSIKSQTVSDHLHSDSGLAGVADQSSLQNIQNTQSDAAFTQDGTALHWDTTDTDVYYKGESTDTPPVTAAISYQLDGSHIAPEDLTGKSGHLTMTVSLTNNTLAQAEVGGSQRTVCTPFAAVVGTMLDEDVFANVTAQHGIVQSDGGSTIVGFATLPGVKSCINDLIPDKLSKVTDYLYDTVTIEADVTNCTVPNIMVACAADASLLKDDDGESILGDLDDLDDLQSDLDKLTDAMDQLLDGAIQLNDGAGDLKDGAAKLADGTTTLVGGTSDLKDGTGTLVSGVFELKNGTSTLVNGAADLKDGAAKLLSGAGDLKAGADTLAGGAGTLKNGSETLAAGAAQVDGGAQSLAAGAGELKTGAESANAGAAQLKGGAADLQTGLKTLSAGLSTLSGNSATLNAGAQAIGDGILATANTQIQAVAPGVTLTWANYADTLGMLSGVTDEMRAQAKAQIAAQSGLDGVNLDALILLANQNLTSTAPTPDDITAAVTAGGRTLAAAQAAAPKIAAAQQALTDAVGNPLAVPSVKAVIDGIIAAQAAAPTALDEQTADAPATPEQAAEEVTADSYAAPDMAAAEQAVYAQLAAAITQGDDATKALLITMACNAMAAQEESDVATAIGNSATAAQAAATANEAVTAATTGSNASDITAFLTRAVIASYGTQLQQAADLVNTLGQVQGFISGLKTYTAGVDQAAAGAVTAYNGSVTLAAGAATLADGTAKLASGAASLKTGADTLAGGTKTLNSGAASLKDGAGSLADGAATLAGGLSTLKDGSKTLADGTGTLASGAATLDSGASSLKDGASTLDDGAATLKDGAKTLDDGTHTLYDGTVDLKDGTQELLDGVNELNDEGISKLTDGIDTDSLETLKDVATEMKNRQEDYTGYAGTPEDVTTSVKFVMKTGENPAPAQTADTATADTTAAPAKTSLWQRFLALFGLGK